MDLAEFTQRMHRFVEEKGWYAADSPKPQTPRNIAASLVVEAAEVLELFQWGVGEPEAEALASELADVFLYLVQLASLSGIELEGAVLEKLRANYRRQW